MDGGRFSLVWTLLLLCIIAKVAEGGECCSTHYDVMGQVMNERWCDDYCCFYGNQYSCCNNPFMRAPSRNRSIVCGNWFTRHIWVPILVGLILLALMIGCGVCCCCLCF